VVQKNTNSFSGSTSNSTILSENTTFLFIVSAIISTLKISGSLSFHKSLAVNCSSVLFFILMRYEEVEEFDTKPFLVFIGSFSF